MTTYYADNYTGRYITSPHAKMPKGEDGGIVKALDHLGINNAEFNPISKIY